LLLQVAEVGRHCDHALFDILLESFARIRYQRGEDEARDLFRRLNPVDAGQSDHAAFTLALLHFERPRGTELLDFRVVVTETYHALGVVDPVLFVLSAFTHRDFAVGFKRNP